MSRNTTKTFVLLALLGGLFVLVGGLIASRGGALIGLALGLLIVGGSYWFSAGLAIRAAGARRVTAAEHPRLAAVVAELAGRAGLPMPELYVAPTAQPNAFATGRNPRHAAVCVTQGALDLLDDESLEGVLAHELSHVANRDILIGSIAAAIAMALTLVARVAMWGTLFGGGRGRRGNPIGLVAMALLAPLAALVMQMAISRSREFEADRSGADLLGSGEALAQALTRIDATARAVPMHVDPAHATAYIVNPLTGRRVAFAQLFATHPPTAERIARLHADTARLQRVAGS
ncbi:MAG TPA: M48 family metalloprotease [Acidimicrobiales bacterium]|jgi:heat shock protein HtpX|nr:M48 family metalloprotease [Acidimicrobiales bacterium]